MWAPGHDDRSVRSCASRAGTVQVAAAATTTAAARVMNGDPGHREILRLEAVSLLRR